MEALRPSTYLPTLASKNDDLRIKLDNRCEIPATLPRVDQMLNSCLLRGFLFLLFLLSYFLLV